MRKSEKTSLSGEQSQVRGDVGNHGKQQQVQWHKIKDVWRVWFAKNEAVFGHSKLKWKWDDPKKSYYAQRFPTQDDFAPRGIFGNVSSRSTATTGRGELLLVSTHPAAKHLIMHRRARTIRTIWFKISVVPKLRNTAIGWWKLTEEKTNKKSEQEDTFKREHKNDTLFQERSSLRK